MKDRIESDIRRIIQKEIQLNLFDPGAFEQRDIQRVGLGSDALRVGHAMHVLPANALERQHGTKRFAVLRRPFTVANLSQVWVLAQVSPSDLSKVGFGDAATIDPGNGTGPFHGTVQNVSATVDPNTRAVLTRIVVPNFGDLLKKQMFVDVSIESGRVSTGLLVPVSAVLHDDENLPFVYVALRDGSFARRHVTLGYRDNQNEDVTSGLSAGDRIVSNGALFLQFMQSQ